MYDAHADKMYCWPNMSKEVLHLLRQGKDRILVKLLRALIPEDCVTSASQTANGKMSPFSFLFLQMQLVEWFNGNSIQLAMVIGSFKKYIYYHWKAVHEIGRTSCHHSKHHIRFLYDDESELVQKIFC
jgi:hypothetical protein